MAPHDPAASSSEDHDARAGTFADRKKRTRTRACIDCRNSKIKCMPVAGQSSCQACLRGSRECVMPGPAKRGTRTTQRVSELERKIELLTEALLTRNEHSPPMTNSSVMTYQAVDRHANDKNIGLTESFDQRSTQMPETLSFPSRSLHNSSCLDLIDRGVLQLDTANILLGHWTRNMSTYVPTVTLPAAVEAQDVRISRPMVFLAILVVASASIQPSLLPKLLLELNLQLAERVMIIGEKSIDLVQALLVYITHFVVPAQAKRSSYTQYVHGAVSVSLDLGLDKRSRPEQLRPCAEVDNIGRTWLACYYTASK
jgi:hypothetical protein